MSQEQSESGASRAKRLLGYGSILAFGIAVVLFGSWWAVNWLSADAVHDADHFLDQLRVGNTEAAYQSSAPTLRERESLDAFRARTAPLEDHADRQWTRRTVDDAGARLEGTVQLSSGELLPVTITQVRQGEGWPVARLKIR